MSATRVTEVAPAVYQLTTHLEDIDFSVNQYLLAGEEPLLFHTGMRGIFAGVSEAVGRVLPPERLRWIGFGHVEADECGSMNQWLGLAPAATVVQGEVGCMVSISDLADRPPRPLASGAVLDLGSHRVRWIDTPHVPHAWEAGVLYDEATRTLFCGDLFARMGGYGPTTTDDVLAPAIAAEEAFPSMSLHPRSAEVVRGLAQLDVGALALMHGPVFTGDCRAALLGLADDLERRMRR